MKVMKRPKLAFTSFNPLQEIALMKKLNHPNIVKLVEVIEPEETDKLYLIMEYMHYGAVLSERYFKEKTILKDENFIPTPLSFEELYRYWTHLIQGLDYLHNIAKVVHRDIKPDNLLINEFNILKIGDFGVSNFGKI